MFSDMMDIIIQQIFYKQSAIKFWDKCYNSKGYIVKNSY